VATLEAAGPLELAFFTNIRYLERARNTEAGAILVKEGADLPGKTLLVVEDPSSTLAELLELFYPVELPEAGVSDDARVADDVDIGASVTIAPFAVVESGSRLGDGARIGAGCFVGAGSQLGAGSVLMPGVVVYPGTVIGRDCLIHSGVVLGGDGFGFATRSGLHRKIPQVGRVVVEDQVEIGANTTVDRGALGDTRIGSGSKIENLVMIAHGVELGPSCLLAGQAGIAGSTLLGKGVTFAGQSGAAGHLIIGDGSVVAAKSAVFADLPEGSFVAGVPARDHREWKKTAALEKRLPEMRAELKRLAKKIRQLESGGDQED
jgi:UDP-3-O-[3-hydroxymyristoyl] glucosamine N-acyltransferase